MLILGRSPVAAEIFTKTLDFGNASNGQTGEYTCQVVVNGNPAVAYYNASESSLMFARNNADDGTGPWTIVTLDHAGTVGHYPSLIVVSGCPAISYHDVTNGGLKYVRATDANGSLWGAPVTVDSNGIVGRHPSMLVVNGAPAMVYYDGTNSSLKYVRATDATGSAWSTPLIVGVSGEADEYSSMFIVNGNPAVAYRSVGSLALRFVRANDVSGASWGTPVTIDNAVNGGMHMSLLVVNGNPAISYYNSISSDLKYVRASDANGTTWGTPQVLDSAQAVGGYTSMAVVGGNPAISYYDFTNTALKYIRASDASGTSWGIPATLESANDVGFYPSLSVVGGNPAISFYDGTNMDLKYIRAGDASGSSWAASTVADAGSQTGTSGQYTSQAMVGGSPAISYFDASTSSLRFIRASLPSGATWGASVIVDSGSVGFFSSLGLVNGNPAISYFDNTNSDLKYVRAVDATGSTWGTPVTVDGVGNVGRYTSLAVIDGNPAISYFDSSNSDLRYVRALDASGTSWGTPVVLDGSNWSGYYTSLVLVNGRPAISYYDNAAQDLKYVRASDSNGTNWGMPVTLDSTGDVGSYTSQVIVDGNPAIAYFDNTNATVKYIRATNADGTAWGTPVTVVSSAFQYVSLAIVGGVPTISYYGDGQLQIVQSLDGAGASWGAPVVFDSSSGQHIALIDLSGFPAVSYFDQTNANLKWATTAVVEVAVAGNSIDIMNCDSSPGVPDHTDFDTQNVTAGAVVRTFIVANIGTGNLSLGPVTVEGPNEGDFSVTTQPAAVVIGGASTAFQVSFDPSGLGPRNATLTFTTSDPDENPFDFVIAGRGVGAYPAAFASRSTVPITSDGFTATGNSIDLALNYAPTTGDELLVVNNTGTAAISGTFTNVAHGQIVPLTYSGITYSFLASYTGGTGNDLTLTALAGALDDAFGSDGLVTTDIGNGNDVPYGVAEQSDGKIVAVGLSFNGNNNDFAVLRYLADGSLDGSFGSGGKVTTAVGSGDDTAVHVSLQNDGKIVVSGWSHNGSNNDYAVVRYNTNGTLDTSFNGTGKVTTAVGSGDDTGGRNVIQPDGRIVVSGWSDGGGNINFALVRYNSDGSLDTSFNGTGKVTTDFSGGQDVPNGMVVQNDGKILAVGTVPGGPFGLARYNADGSLDTSFGSGGKVTTTVSGSGQGSSVALQSDGKIVCAGYNNPGNVALIDFVVLRYNTDGSLDTSFGTDGKVITDVGGNTDEARKVMIQSNGKVVVAGASLIGANYDFSLVRYTADGSLDTSFNGTGKVTTPIGSGDEYGYSMMLQSDGRILVVGQSHNDFALARYLVETNHKAVFASAADVPLNSNAFTATGQTVNITLGYMPTAGTVLTLVNNTGSSAITGTFTGLANGQIVPLTYGGITYNFLANYAGGTGNDLTLTALAGALDEGFGTTGKAVTPVSGNNDRINAVVTQPDGKIVAAGATGNYPEEDFAIARYHADGTLDTSFNGTGKITLGLAQNDVLEAVTLQSDGKIVVAGYTGLTTPHDFAVLRFNSDGTPDTSFNGNGRVITAVGSGDDLAYSVAVQPDGKILVAGGSLSGGFYNFSLARYLTDGALDTSFNGTGKVSVSVDSGHDVANGMVLQSDGKIVVAGYAAAVSGSYDFAVARFNANGTLDTTFGGAGTVITDIGGDDELARSVAVQPNGKILLAGFATIAGNDEVALVRYNFDGTLDTGFNGTGKVVGGIGTGNDGAMEITLDIDGKILVSGYSTTNSNADFALSRFNTDGSLDSGFGNGGKITTAIGSGNDKALALALQADGNVVLAGSSFNGSDDDFALARYTMETAYSGTFTSAADAPFAATAVTATGRTLNLALGFAPSPGTELRLVNNTGPHPITGNFTGISHGATVPLTYNSVMYNFIANYTGGTGNDLTLLLPGPGGLDYAFNGSGRVRTPMPATEYEELYGMALQNDGRILVTSGVYNGANYDFGIARYLPDGLLDGSFGGGGVVVAPLGAGHDFSAAVTAEPNGKILVAGQSYNGSNPVYKAALARFQLNGALDNAGFNGSGIVETNLNGLDDRFYAVAVQQDGKVVAVGRAHGIGVALMRFHPDGSVDAGFNPGNNGKLMFAVESVFGELWGVAIQPDGKIVAVGSTAGIDGPTSNFLIVRCNANGTLDASFNSGSGTKTVDFNGCDYAEDVAFQPDGKILVAGSGNILGNSTFALTRLNPDGTLDSTFGTAGKVTADLSSGEDMCFGMGLQADGKIVIGGHSGGDFAVVRYLANGTLDSNFHGTGKAIFPMGATTDKALDLAIQTDGKIVLSGYSFNGSTYDYALARLTVESTSNVSFAGTSDVPLTFNGLVPTGRTLNLTLNIAPNVGTRLKVFNNTSLHPISGEFSNLAHGQVVTLNYSGTDYSFVANYFGGDGNDLTLEWAGTKLTAFGGNGSGQLGITGPAALENVPTQVVATAAIYQKTVLGMSSGEAHSLAVCSDGTAAAWGSNMNGQLGNGGTVSSSTPVAVTMGGVLNGKKVIAVAAGAQHSLALCSDGTLAAWGEGSSGQIGDNGTLDRLSPVLVSTAGALNGKRVIAISAGATHSAALCSDGTVVCWGGNTNGELGNASNTQSNVPVVVSTGGVLLGRTVTAIACGENHTLALLLDGGVAGWGRNASGQLGNSSTAPSNVPVLVDAGGLLNGKRVAEIAAGGSSSFARCSEGVLAAWGLNDRGQLGVNNVTTSFTVPQAVLTSGVLSGETVARLFAGKNHAGALCSDGTLATWGEGNGGELGESAFLDRMAPVLVSNAILGGTDVFIQTASGATAGHTFALIGTTTNEPLLQVESPAAALLSDSTSNQIVFGTTLPGTVKTRVVTIRNIGTQTLSGIGVTITGSGANPSNFSISTPPAATLAPGDATSFTLSFAPSTIGSKTVVLEIASNVAGTANPFSIGVQGTVLNTLAASYTTGQEVPAAATGFTATGKTVNFSLNYAPPTGTRLLVVNNTGAAFISGAFGNLAHGQVVTLTHNATNYNFVADYFGGDGNDLVLHWAATRLLAWGANSTGTLGNNGTAPSLSPAAVSMSGVLNGKTILSVAAGERHSLAVCSDGTLAAWGANNAGQLGDASNMDRLVPVLVSTAGALNGRKVIAAAAGYDFSIALCADGTLVTFGANSGGQLGNNSIMPSNVPVAISSTGALSGKSVVSIAAGYDFGLASCADGTVVAWGQNAYGQFGNNSINNSLVPVAATTAGVLSGKTVRSVAAGHFHSLAICTDGTLAGWGDNSFGELGDGSNDSSLVPVLVNSSGALAGKVPVQVSASMLHSAALCSDGTVVAWGDNSFGQLGLSGIESSFLPVVAATGGVMNGRVAGFLGGGQMHHVIAVTDGYPAAWGDNSSGQLGNGVTSASFVPAAVSTAAFGAGERVVRVSSGCTGLHSIGIVAMPLTSGGSPVVSTNAAESINKTSAMLKGLVNPSGTATTAYFEYGVTTSYGSVMPIVPESVGSGSASVSFSQAVNALQPNTTYHYRIVASNTNGAVFGDDFSFTTLPDPPLAVTTSANTVTNTTATLSGTVNPNTRATTIHFEFGTTTLYGNTTAPQNIAAGSSNVNLIAPISGLTLGTTYHFRLVAQNSGGTAYGDDSVFTTTSISPPALTLFTPDAITTTGVTLKGSVNPNGSITTAWFEYGLTTTYTGITSVAGLGAVTSPQPVSLTIASLSPATTYHYRLVAENSAGITQGTDATFTTLPLPPTVTTQFAVALSTTSARLHGTVNAQNGSAEVTFEWGTDGANFPNQLTATQSPVTGGSDTAVSADISNLAQFTVYHYRVKAVSAGGTNTGAVLTFQPAIISGLQQQFPTAAPASSGSLTVTLVPSGIASGWRFVGERQWRGSGETADHLTTGDREIEFKPVAGYIRPLRETASVISGNGPLQIERTYFETQTVSSGSVSVTLKPDGIAGGGVPVGDRAQWRLLGDNDSQWRDSGTSLAGLPLGQHLIECKPLAGRTTPPVAVAIVQENLTTLATLTYFLADSPVGTPPEVLAFSSVSTNQNLPYAWVGQIRSDAGLSTGFAVKARVVATAAHVVWDDGTLSAATGLQWLHQRDKGTFEPKPLIPRGFYIFDGYAAQRAADNSPGTSSPQSQHLDVAALYFNEDAARGGFSGFLASDLPGNEFLLSNAQKMLVGYPVDGIATANQGRMHATPAANVAFTQGFGRTYTTTGIRSGGGNSGGPLCVQHVNGNYYPAAVYLGGSGQTVVRAFDSAVIDLFTRAEDSGGDGENHGGGGITHRDVITVGTSDAASSIQVTILPAGAAQAGAGWRLKPEQNYRNTGESRGDLRVGNYILQMKPVAGYQPPNQAIVQVQNGGQVVAVEYTYEPLAGGLETWRQTHFGASANSGAGADTADPDNDGVENLVEFAFGLNPNSASSAAAHLPQWQRVGDNWELSFTPPAGVSGISYIAEQSSTLAPGSWSPIPNTGTAPQRTYTIPVTTGPARTYLRVRIAVP